MNTQRFWWCEIHPFRPKDAREKYPHPGEVVAYYREQMDMMRRTLAQTLGLSASEVCRLENDGVGLDSIIRCRELGHLLHIPLALFGLDDVPHVEQSWWVAEGYPPFDRGNDGYPLAGQVIKHYRERKYQQARHVRYTPGEEQWTQHGLAEALGVSEFTVRKMENYHKGLDPITRREALSFILSIPPVLLGLDSLAHTTLPGQQKHTPRISTKPRNLLLDTQVLDRYRQDQHELWTEYFTHDGHEALTKATRESRHLRELISLTQGEPQRQLIELESLCQQFIAAVALERRDFPTVFAHANQAVIYAKSIEKSDLLASALLRRGMAHYGCGQLSLAIADIDEAKSLIPEAPAHISGTVFQNAGMIHAHMLQDETDLSSALGWLDDAEDIARSGDFTEDLYFLKFNVGMYHIRRAIALIAIGRANERRRKQSFQEALGELELAQRTTSPEMTRRHALINLFRAQAHCGLKEFGTAAKEAQQALDVFKKIRSRINIGYIADLYEELCRSTYGNAPIVVRLGWELEQLGATETPRDSL